MENCLGEPPQPQNPADYYPHYSLFQSSLFYDTDNIRISSLTCKYDSLTTESGIRTFEYRKSSDDLDDCRTESEHKYSEDPHNAEPMDKEDIGGHRRRWYSRVRTKCYKDLTHSLEPPDKNGTKSSGTVCGLEDLAQNAEPLDIEEGYTLFRPNWSDNLVHSIEPRDKEDIEKCHIVSGPMWPVDLARHPEPSDKDDIENGYTLFQHEWPDNLICSIELPDKGVLERSGTRDVLRNTEPLDKEDIEEYTLFGPKQSDNQIHRIQPQENKDVERRTMSGPMWPVNPVRSAGPPDIKETEAEYTLFGPKQSVHRIEPPDKEDTQSCRTVSGPMWPVNPVRSAGPPDKEGIEGGFTLFRPTWSDNLVRSIQPLDKRDIERSGTVARPKQSTDLLRNTERQDKEDIEEGYTLFGPKQSNNLICSIEPMNKVDLEGCRTVSRPMWPVDQGCSAKPPEKEDIEGEYTLLRLKWFDNLARNIQPLDKSDLESSGTVARPKRSTDLLRNVEPQDKEVIKERYTLFGPKESNNLIRSIEPLVKEDLERCRTVSRSMWPVDLACSVNPLEKVDTEGGYTLLSAKWPDNLVCSTEPQDKKDIQSFSTVPGWSKWSKDLVSNTESLENEDIDEEYTLFGPIWSEDPVRSIDPLEEDDIERYRTVPVPERSEDLACSAEPPENEEDVEPEPEKRIITKKELYRDPDLFKSRSEQEVEPIAPQPENPKPWGYYDWTRQIGIHKETGESTPMNRREELDEEQRQAWGEAWRQERRGEWRAIRGGSQSAHPLAEPPRVERGVAENTTRAGRRVGGRAPRGGWQGGALGRVGDGGRRPITKDPKNESRSAGSGKRPSAKPKQKKLSPRDVFRTNVLLFILDFVRDDTEVQLKFDDELKQCERRQIRTIVSHIITAGYIELLGTIGQYDLVLDIQIRNQYQISVVSEGDEDKRWLSIYKEAPGHVYLVTPDDFLPKEDDETDDQSPETSNDQASRNSDDDDNPFLRSIEKGLKKKVEKESNISEMTEKMLEFFLEFVDSEEFTEMWFLGEFTKKQSQVISELFDDLSTCIHRLDNFHGDREIARVFRSGVQLQLKEGNNETIEIHKVSANR